jgi:hypothetical protein
VARKDRIELVARIGKHQAAYHIGVHLATHIECPTANRIAERQEASRIGKRQVTARKQVAARTAKRRKASRIGKRQVTPRKQVAGRTAKRREADHTEERLAAAGLGKRSVVTCTRSRRNT